LCDGRAQKLKEAKGPRAH